MALISLRSIAQALGGEVSGGQVLAPGPGHGTEDRSLSVKLSERPGDIVVHSFAGNDALECKDYVRSKLGLPAWQPQRKKANGHAPSRSDALHIVATYVYKQSDGTNCLRVQRTADKKFLQSHWNGAAWVSGKPPGPKIPYRLPDIIDEGTVFVCEGEKCADAVAALSFAATTASEGAGKWTAELNEHFKDKTVYVLADNDVPGAQHARLVASNLHTIADSVRVVLLPGLTDKGDVSDWLAAGGTAEQLLDICRDTPVWTQKPEPEDKPQQKPEAPNGSPVSGLNVWNAAKDTDAPPPRGWLLGNTFCRRFLSSLFGDGGVGKTAVRYAQALALATGRNLTGEYVFQRARVLIVSLEDDADELRRRILAARLHFNIKASDIDGWLFLSSPGAAAGKLMATDLERPRRARATGDPPRDRDPRQHASTSYCSTRS